MTTFATMRNQILDDLNRTKADDLTATCENSIKTAIAHYEKQRFWFLEKQSTTSTVNGQEYYPVPTDFYDNDSLVIRVNNYTYPLNERTYATLEDWFVRSSVFTGYPSDYTIYSTGETAQIRLYPVPNGAYTLTLSYYGKLAEVNAESDTNTWFKPEGEALIRARAEFLLYAQKLRDYDAAQAVKIIENEELAQIDKLTKMRQFTGRTQKRRMARWR